MARLWLANDVFWGKLRHRLHELVKVSLQVADHKNSVHADLIFYFGDRPS